MEVLRGLFHALGLEELAAAAGAGPLGLLLLLLPLLLPLDDAGELELFIAGE